MPNKIILKKSSVALKVPVAGDLEYGELALNYVDEKLYFKNTSNAIKSFNVTQANLTIGTGLSGSFYNGTSAVTVAIDSSVVTLDGTQTLTNKTIAAGSNTISGLTNSNLSGTAGITNANLANSSVTVGSTAIALGATSTTLAGLTSVTSTTFVGALTGNATNVSGTVAIANGGTGQTTRQAAIDALAGSVTAGQYLRGDGTDVVMSAIQAADVPTLNQNTSGTAANVSGTVAIANGGTGATSAAAALTNLGAYAAANPSGYTSNTGTVTSIATNNGITGGTITTTGTLGLTGQALALHNLATNGIIARTGADTFAGRTLTASTGITISNGDGVSGNPTITNSAPDQTVALTGAGATSITGTYPNFTITSVNTTYSKATTTSLGLVELGSDTVQTVAANSVSATASRSYAVQLNAADQMVVNVPWVDTNTTYTDGDGIALTGTVFSVAAGSGLVQEASGLAHADTSSQASVDNANGNVIQDITLDTFGHITAITSLDLDGRYYTETEADSRFVNTAGDTMTGFLTLHADPTSALHAVTKQYVDSIAQGLHVHAPSLVATPGTLTSITGGTITYANGTSGVGATLTVSGGTYGVIDGVNIATVGNRILVRAEANTAHNGIYTYTSSTVLTRAEDFNTSAEMGGGDFTFVQQGTLYNDTGWVLPDPVTTVGTTGVVFSQFSGAGTYTAGSGLTLNGTQFSHTDTSSAATLTASGRTYVTGLTFDTFGHVTAYTTGTETVVDTNTTYSAATSTTLGLVELFSDTAQTVAANAVSATASRTYGLQLNAASQGVINVPWTDTVYTLPTATSTALGGVELFSDTVQTVAANAVSATASRTYGVQFNSANQMVVNVPWTDTDTDTNTVTRLRGTASGTYNSGDLTLLAGSNVTITQSGTDYTIAASQPTVGDGTLSVTTKTAGATNTDVTLELSGAYSANTSTNRTIKAVVGPALTNLATLMATAGAGFIRRTATADTYSIDTSTYLTGTKVDSISATSPIVASASTGAVTLSHATSGVTAGTYNNVTVNATGHVTSGSNVSYLTSYSETDTLSSVTGRGATTSTYSTFSGGLSVGTASTRDKLRVWDSNLYSIGMQADVQYGGLSDYAMTFQFNDEDDRGFWWGDSNHNTSQGAMALTTNGYLTVARRIRVGGGETDTSIPQLPFEVVGTSGQLFSVTDSMTGTIFSANDVSGIPSIEVLDTGLVKIAQYSGNLVLGSGIDNGTDKLQVNGSILGTSIKGSTLVSTVATGTAPLTVSSITVVPNLNADLWDGYQFASYLNQAVRTSDSPSFNQVYANNWFRNNANNTGLYNENTTQHWSSQTNGYWDASSTTTFSGIRLYTGSHLGALRGYVYANTSNEIGFLDQAGNWTLRMAAGVAYATTFSGALSGTASTVTSRTLTIGNTGKAVDHSADVSWTLAEIGAYAATNPSGYTTNTGTVTSVGGTGTVSGLTLTGTVTGSGNLTLGGTLTLTSGQVTTALGFTPAASTGTDATGDAGAISFRGGNSSSSGFGGAVTVTGGTSASTTAGKNGGAVTISGGNNTSASGGFGASLSLPGGTAAFGDGGQARLYSGDSKGTNIAGADLMLFAGRGTGTGVGGTMRFYTSGVTTSGAGLQTHTSRLEIDSLGQVFARANITSTSTTTGTLRVTGGVGVSGTVFAAGFNGPLTGNVTGNVSGSSATAGTATNATTASTAVNAINVGLTDNTTSTSTHYISMHDATSGNDGTIISTTKISFQPSTGNLTAAGNVTAFSDERLKTDWNTLPETFVEDLANVKSGTYTRIDTNVRQAGASAQDWQKLLPEVVGANDQGDLTLAYGNAALVSAIELAKRVVSQDAKIATLEDRIANLESVLNKLLEK
jgi:hypothetical protein